jgi:mxaC protein
MIGLITFSNSAMYVLPLTESREAVLAAIRATAGNSLFQTNIGGGLTSAVGLFKDVPDSGSRAIILLSDGAGRVGSDVQQKLRDWLQRYNISLYWIILKKPNSRSVLDEYIRPDDEALPAEIELYNYFKSLRTPFEVYEAENPKALASAIADINQKEKKPIKYFEKIPGRDFTSLCYALAILMIVLLIGVKYLEVRTWRSA